MELLSFALSFLAWFFIPWVGVFGFLALKIKFQKFDFLCVLMIVLTVMLYQLALPMPYDLEVTKSIFLETAKNPSSSWALSWIVRDPLSYGILNLLTYLIPSLPISFYLINSLLLYGCLWLVYSRLRVKNTIENFALLCGIFILILNFQETHHYLRQTTALSIFVLSLFFNGAKRYLILIAAVLWHGSTILYLPTLFFLSVSKKNNYGYYVFFVALSLSLILSEFNIYELLKSESFTRQGFEQFSFFDRFMTYFKHARHASYYEIYKQNGNLEAIVSIVLGLVTIGYTFIKRQTLNITSSLLMCLILWISFFRYHVLVYDRVQYVFTIVFLFYWVKEISSLDIRRKDLLSIIVLLISGIKITFFTWGIDTNLYQKPLFLVSPLEILVNYNFWPINQD